MAIERPLRGQVLHVWSQDPALDRTDERKLAEHMKKFRESSKLEDLEPVLKPGEKPTVFELQSLARKHFLHVTATPGAVQDHEAVSFGLKGVRNFSVRGIPLVVKFTDGQAHGARLDEETLDALYDFALFGELGARLVEISRLCP